MPTAKICGLSTEATLDAAIAHGASHVGFVFFPKSPRDLSLARAEALSGRVPSHIKTVGVFVDPDPKFVDEAVQWAELDVIQLHGSETPEKVAYLKRFCGVETWKAVPVRTRADLADAGRYAHAADRILYDAKPPKGADLPGGMGLRFDWRLLQGHRHPLPWALSGGLDAASVAEAVQVTSATLLDISSGVESSPGVKDVDKIAAFLQSVARS